MIVKIDKTNKKILSHIMDQYFHQRYKVFCERLSWSLEHNNLKEVDEYDTDHTEYLIYIDPKFGVCGGVRLNPTTLPYMLSQTFQYLLPKGQKAPVSPKIWESSRFFVNMPANENKETESKSDFIKKATKVLFLAVIKFGFLKKLNSIVTVTDLKIERIIRSSGWCLNRLSEPKPCEDDPRLISVAGILEVSKKYYENIKEKANIDVLNLFKVEHLK